MNKNSDVTNKETLSDLMNPTGIPKKSHLLYRVRQGTKHTEGERVQDTTFQKTKLFSYLVTFR